MGGGHSEGDERADYNDWDEIEVEFRCVSFHVVGDPVEGDEFPQVSREEEEAQGACSSAPNTNSFALTLNRKFSLLFYARFAPQHKQS